MTLLETLIASVIAILVFVFVTDLLFRLYKEYKFAVDYSMKIRQAANVINGMENDFRGIELIIRPTAADLTANRYTKSQATTDTGTGLDYASTVPFHARTNANGALVIKTKLFENAALSSYIGYVVNVANGKLKRIIYTVPAGASQAQINAILAYPETNPNVKVSYMGTAYSTAAGTEYFKDLRFTLIKNSVTSANWFYNVEAEIYLNLDTRYPSRSTTYKLVNKIFIKLPD